MKQTNEIYESTNDQSFKDFKEKVIKGLQLAYQRMIEEKKTKKKLYRDYAGWENYKGKLG